eukprot:Opistho-2@33700
MCQQNGSSRISLCTMWRRSVSADVCMHTVYVIPTDTDIKHYLSSLISSAPLGGGVDGERSNLIETKALSRSLVLLLQEGHMSQYGDRLLAAGYANLSDLSSLTEDALTGLDIPDYHARVILRCVPGVHQNVRPPPPPKVLRAVSLQRDSKRQSTRRLDTAGRADIDGRHAGGGAAEHAAERVDTAEELPLDASMSLSLSLAQSHQSQLSRGDALSLPPVQTNGRVSLVAGAADPILMSARTNQQFLREYYLGPGDGDGRGFVYVFMSPDMLRMRKAVYKLGSATTGDPVARTCPRVDAQRKHYGNVRILDVYPAAFHAFATRLSRALLDRGEYCRPIDAVQCVNPACQTLHREWYGPAVRGGTADRAPHDPYPIIRKVIAFCIASASEWSPSGASPFA